MGTNALPNSFFGVIISQGFQADKPLFPRWPDSDIFSRLDLIALLFQIGQKMFKEEGAGNSSVHIPADLTVPCRFSLLLGLPGIITHGAALFRVFYDGQATLPAKLVGGLTHQGITGFAVVALLPIHKIDRVQ